MATVNKKWNKQAVIFRKYEIESYYFGSTVENAYGNESSYISFSYALKRYNDILWVWTEHKCGLGYSIPTSWNIQLTEQQFANKKE